MQTDKILLPITSIESGADPEMVQRDILSYARVVGYN